MQFDGTQSTVHAGDLQTADINTETHSETYIDDSSGLVTAESSSTHETARDCTIWESMELGVEAPGMGEVQNI